MEYNIANNILMLFAIISLVAADSNSTAELKHKVLDHLSGHICPPFGKNAKFEVETIQTKSLMYGCAYMGNENRSLFHLWLERSEPTNGHGHCNNIQNMDHFMFECLSKHNRPVNQYESVMGWHYVSLLDHTPESMRRNTKTRSYRCALYDVNDQDDRMIRIIRMVISKPELGVEFNASMCDGLSELLGRDLLPIIPEGFRFWPDGSLYIYLLGRKAKSFYTTTQNPEVVFPIASRPTTITSPPTTTTTTTRRPTTTTTTIHPTTTTTTTRRPTTTTTTIRPTTITTSKTHTNYFSHYQLYYFFY